MSTQDENFLRKLRETFQAEAREHIQSISNTLLELEKAPPNALPPASVEVVFRSVHSLKGAARSVGIRDVETICQSMENVFQSWKNRRIPPNSRLFDTLHHAVDTLTTLLSGTDPGTARARDEIVSRLDAAAAAGGPATPPPPPQATPIFAPASTTPPLLSRPSTPQPPSQPAPQPAAPEPLTTTLPASTPAAQSVRVQVAKLDARLLQAEGMLSIKNSAIQQAANLRDTVAQFDEWQTRWMHVSSEAKNLQQAIHQHEGPSQVQASAQLVSFLEFNHDYIRSLQERLRELAQNAAQDRHHIARSVDSLLQDSKELLMLPFQTVADVFPKLVRDISRDQGKDARLTVQGSDVPIDKRILEETKDVFIHLLRNCVDHAIESPDQRTRLGKPPTGTITIAVSRQGSGSVEIVLTDDGSGINAQGLKNAALKLGHITHAQAQSLTDAQACQLMFLSGTSTSPKITSISGRGLGMAIVHSKILGLGGHIQVQSTLGKGTTFKITLPSTLSTFRGVLIHVGAATCLVPSASVVRVIRVSPDEIQSVENRQSISVDGRPVSLVLLQGILGVKPGPSAGGQHKFLPVLLLEAAQQQMAFIVDEVLHEEEVLVKPLPQPLKRVRNIAGAAVIRSGDVAVVLDIPDLMASARSPGQPQALFVPRDTPVVTTTVKRILVVEDSITSRMLIKGILESAGYDVRTAVDGVEGFTVLREEPFDLVVSDVEMPRMTGLDLTARIRTEKRFEHLPVILVTALESQAQREQGIDAGANAYIVKSRFDQSNLLQTVQRLI